MQPAGSRGDGVGALATCEYDPRTDVTRDDHGSSGIHRLQVIAGNPCGTRTLVCRKLAEAGRGSLATLCRGRYWIRFPIESSCPGGRESGKLDISAIINREFRKCSLTICSGNSSPCAPAHA